jgi:hypothetical protein
MKLTSGGKTQELNLTEGEAISLNQDHEATSIGDIEIDLLVVELK